MIRNFLLWLARKKGAIFLWLDRQLVGKSWKQLSVVVALFSLILLLVTGVYTIIDRKCDRDRRFDENIHRVFVDMTNSESVRQKVNDTVDMTNIEMTQRSFDNTTTQSKKKPGFWSVFVLAFVYVLGAVFFTGLLIATITNIWRARSDKFRQGSVRYPFKNHIVFLGYNDLIAGIIQKICEEKDAEVNRKRNVRIVVGVENNASVVCDKIKNRLFDNYRNNVVVLKADSCNRSDLERLSITEAEVVYIIGEYDDAYNLKCYRTIYELSLCERSRESRMPKCYVHLQSQATLTLFRTYASSGELGVDFAEFHSFSFYDEWAREMIQKNWKGDKEFQEHFIIVGMTEMGLALARKVALLCHNPNDEKHTIITLIDAEANAKAKHFIMQHQEFFDYCKSREGNFTGLLNNDRGSVDIEFEFVEGELSDDSVRREISKIADGNNQTTTIALCYDDAQINLSLGLCLPSNAYNNSNVRIWIYQPALGDIGKYLKGERYKNVVTFGMSGTKLDIRNKEATQRAEMINHYFLHKESRSVDYSNDFLIKKEWDCLDIANQWAFIRFAEFIPLLADYDCISDKIVLMKNRSAVDYYLFGIPLLEDQDESILAMNEEFIEAITIINHVILNNTNIE